MVIDFSNKELFNEIYLPFFDSNKRYKIAYGGRDSGKSDAVAQDIIMSMLGDEYFRLILIRRYYVHIKQSQFQTLVDYIRLWELQDLFHITLNPLTIVCKNNYHQIFARGLDQPDNTKSVKDPTANWYEEADQISEEAFNESSISLRSSRSNKLTEYFTFNPRRESCWINKMFFPPKNSYEKEDGNFHWVQSINPDAIILHTTYKDNNFCSVKRAARLESLKEQDENYYKVNTLGLWGGALKGLIFPHFTICDSMPEGGDEVFGFDYGYNHATALVHESYKERRLYMRQLIYVTGHNHQQIINIMLSEYKTYIGKKLIVVDSEEPALIKALRMAGFNAIPSEKGPGSVYNGIMLMKQLELFITRDSPDVINEFQGYIWKKDKDGNSIDEPVKIEDDAVDASRYPVQTYGKKYWFNFLNINNSPKKERIKIKDPFAGF